MAVKIRMKRLGAKKAPFYRIVVADSRRARNGRFIEELGFYNPIAEPRSFRVDADKVKTWIANGAQTSETVKRLFKEYGVYEAQGTVEFGKKEKTVQEESVVDFTPSKKEENLEQEDKEEVETSDPSDAPETEA